MKVRSIRVVRSRTMNLGDFESTRFEYEASADLEEGEDEVKALAQLDILVRNQIKTAKDRVDKMLAKREAEGTD